VASSRFIEATDKGFPRRDGCYASLGSDIGSVEPAQVAPGARAAAARALELDPNLAEAHGALAKIKLEFDWD
jgi:hypothetical protein